MSAVSPEQPHITVAEAVERADQLAVAGGRRIVGIVGAPGAGKSTLAEHVAASVGVDAVVVPMDGFHLAHAELERLGRVERKGAIDTFDADGLVALVRRLAENANDVVYAPVFNRDIEDSIAGAIGVSRGTPLVIIEGLYLLVDRDPWGELTNLLDETWFLGLDDETRLNRLIARHEHYGRDHSEAVERATGSDQVNAELVAASAARATLVVDLDSWSHDT